MGMMAAWHAAAHHAANDRILQGGSLLAAVFVCRFTGFANGAVTSAMRLTACGIQFVLLDLPIQGGTRNAELSGHLGNVSATNVQRLL